MKASENAKAARSARGRKEGSRPFLASMRASLPPYNLVSRAFPSENGRGAAPAPPFSKGKALGTARGYPPQTPATYSTLKSLGTSHLLGGANIRSETE